MAKRAIENDIQMLRDRVVELSERVHLLENPRMPRMFPKLCPEAFAGSACVWGIGHVSPHRTQLKDGHVTYDLTWSKL